MVKKLRMKNFTSKSLLLFGGLLLNVPLLFSQVKVDSLLTVANTKIEIDYTIPSFTELKRSMVSAQNNPDSTELVYLLENAINNLKAKETPYNIVINIYQDPSTKMAFNWFTNTNITGGKVQIVQGRATGVSDFNTPLMSVNAQCLPIDSIVYNHSRNGLNTVANIPNGTKKSYTENKAIVTGLTPNTTYSFRVGKEGAWSEIGTFSTAKPHNEAFCFVYTTDPQANTYEMFDISQRTAHAAFNKYPETDFWLHCGDLVESSGSNNSEWEWEQLFETQQDIFLNTPFAPIQGNHDKSTNCNFTRHFNTDSVNFDRNMATSPGSVYSFVYGDALFMALSFEDYSKVGYLDSLANWMKEEVAKHPNTKWRIAYYHKAIYTGSKSHQSDNDAKIVREKMAPVFDSLKIDIAFQGHDHIYEVIGPVKSKQLIAGATTNQTIVTPHSRENVTGKLGGIYNTEEGTLYFLNNSSGKKKYEPRSQAEMAAAESNLGIVNYYGLFTGRFGQTGRPTFSNVIVSTDTITITTYEVFENDSAGVFDEFKVVKTVEEPIQPKVYVNNTSDYIGNYQNIDFYEGGFSGMYVVPGTNGTEFYVNGDRGPNIDFKNNLCQPSYDKMYPFPTYAPKILRVKIAGDSIQILETITIKRPDGTTATGLLNPEGFGSTANERPFTDTISDCDNAQSVIVDKDVWGIDAEGIVIGNNNDFWICEEGAASIWNVNSNGKVIKRYSPYADLSGAEAQDIAIDTVFKYRKNNRGFEGVAITPNGKVYSLIQSSILYPNKTDGEKSSIHRLLEIDPTSGEIKMYAYLNPGKTGTGSDQIKAKDWKIGDLAAVNDSTFLVIEQGVSGDNSVHNIYEIKINQATPVSSGLYGGQTLEQLKDAEGLASQGIIPVQKRLFLDLIKNNWPKQLDKVEGLTIINDSTIAVCNDNDYGQYSPNEDGIAVATGIKSYIYIYNLPVDKKIENFVPRQADITPEILPVSIMLDRHTLNLKVDSSEMLTANIFPENTTNKNLIWSSSNSNIATVNGNGNVTGIAVGTAFIIVATEENNLRDSSIVTVTNTVNIQDLENNNVTITLTPNPTTGLARLYTTGINEKVTLTITTISGTIISSKIHDLERNPIVDIDLGGYAKGVYLISIQTKHNSHVKKLIVK